MKHSTNSLVKIIIMTILLTTIKMGYAKEIIDFGAGILHKDHVCNMKLLSVVFDDKSVCLNIEIKMKYGSWWDFNNCVITGYDENHNILNKRAFKEWGLASNEGYLDGGWSVLCYRIAGKRRIILKFCGPLYNNVKNLSIIDRDTDMDLFGDIPVSIKKYPVPPKIEEKQIREIIDSTKNTLSGIYEYNYQREYKDYKAKVFCLPKDNKIEFFNLEDCEHFVSGEKIGECFSLNDGKSYKGKWHNWSDFLFSLDGNVLSIWNPNNRYSSLLNPTATLFRIYPVKNARIDTPVKGNNEYELLATGSGILISDNIIITNNHVIDGANKIEVVINANGIPETYSAKVLCTDKTNDLAIVCVKDEKFKNVGDAPFSIKSNVADVGTSVFAMGFPMSQYLGDEVKVTDGIISSKSGFDGDLATYQISAAIQPGNSGGPLFDNTGNLIGITSAGLDKRIADNVGYAIKSSYVLNLIDSAPINIKIPNNSNVKAKDLPDLIKTLKPYVVLLKIY